jgi:hypothetical protein
MQISKKSVVLSTALTVFCLVGVSHVGAANRIDSSPLSVSLVQPPTVDAQEVVPAEPAPPVEAPLQELESGVSYCKPACITYRYRGRCRKTCCDCGPDIETVLTVPDCRKCGCGCFAVPVCIPGCCTDAPCVTCRHGIFGRGVAVYTWCCGYKIVVNITKCSDVIVTQICP